jgi:two-component system vancomycin resistance associated response regulator VraR
MDSIQAIIVGEEEAFRKGIASILEAQEAFQVINSLSILEAMKQFLCSKADLIIMDLRAPKNNTAEVVKALKQQCPCSKIIAIISNNPPFNLVEIIAYGIDSCIPEGLMCKNFIRAIKLACSSELFIFPIPAKQQMLQFNSSKATSVVDINCFKKPKGGIADELTKREQEILELMASNYSNKEIGKILYVTEPTVKTHVSSILRKLGQRNRAQAILFAYKTGLLNDSLA